MRFILRFLLIVAFPLHVLAQEFPSKPVRSASR